jgi:pyruvate dehydrogenase E1 component alpha subunit
LNDADAGFIAASAILGQTMATAVGSALAFRMDGLDRVAVTFFGDGTVEEGIFHESLNFAVVKKLPVLFVCENNGYSTHTPLSVRQPASVPIHERARSYGMPSAHVDGNDVFAVFTAARDAVAAARRGDGPSFLECVTYRWREHVGPLWDYDQGYRTKAEVDEWIARCPMTRESRSEIERAVAAAKAAPFPDVRDLTAGTY